MSITLALTAPVSNQAPGDVSIAIDISSTSPGGGFADSFLLWINDVAVTDFATNGAGPWDISYTATLLGGQAVRVKVQAVDIDEARSSVWLFNVDPEVTLSGGLYRRAFYLEDLITYYPEHTKARGDKYSVFQQLLNPLALKLEENRLRLHNENRALNPSKDQDNDPDWLYEYALGPGESFTVSVDALGNEVSNPPNAWGITGINRLPLAPKGSFREFWSNALPSRYLAENQGATRTQLTRSTPISESEHLAPFDVPVPGFLYFWIHSVSGTVELGDELRLTKLQIEGTNPEGTKQEESISLVRNYTAVTQKPWGRVDSIKVSLGPIGATAEFVVYNFPQRASAIDDPFFRSSGEVIRWNIGSDDDGSYVDMETSARGLVADVAIGTDTFQKRKRCRLLDAAGDHVTITDFSIDPTTTRMYGVDGSKVYIWDRRETWPVDMTLLNNSATSPEADFHVVKIGDDVAGDGAGNFSTEFTIELDRPQALRTIRRWNWSVVDDAGYRFYLDGANALTTNEVPLWKSNSTPISYFGIEQRDFVITIDTLGAFIFELTVEFMDGTTETVRKVDQAYQNIAQADYLIDHLVTVSGVNTLTALEGGGLALSNRGSTWLLTPMFDDYISDFESYRLLFREAFDSVEVNFNE
tara:strand:+ start:1113 stop:3038 length:1926 start_codon:yes stop_codon:yes gene_type:complete